MNPFSVDYMDLTQVTDFAAKMSARNPKFVQYVVKYPNRENYNITMQRDKAIKEGAVVLWCSSEQN